MRTILIILFFFGLLFSCKKEKNEVRLSDFQTPLITGFVLVNEQGGYLGTIGIPNRNLGPIFAYPNPVKNYLAVSINGTNLNEPRIEYGVLWITNGVYNLSPNNLTTDLGSSSIVIGGTPLIQIDSVHLDGVSNIILDVQKIPKGYYRLYLKAGNSLFWDNIIVDK